MAALAGQTYTPLEETEIQNWEATAITLKSTPSDVANLSKLNDHLNTRTTVLGTKPSRADVSLYEALAPTVASWSAEQRTGKEGLPNVVRLVDFVQNSPIFGLDVKDKVAVNHDEILYVKPPIDPKAEKKKKTAAAAAAAAGKGGETGDKSLVDRTKEKAGEVADKVKGAVEGQTGGGRKKKEKQPKPAKQPAVATPPAPHLIDLRVGHILKAVKHPEADSLYVSTIAMGDKPGTDDTAEYEGQVTRTVCSGLNGLVPLEEMQGRKVVCVCNLKPVKMRGIKSCAMVLAASPKIKEGETDDHKGPVELVNPPEGAQAGQKIFFEGYKGEPEGTLNPKKKVWEMFQPGFTTTDGLEVVFDAGAVPSLAKEGQGKLVTEKGEVCTVKTLKGATVRPVALDTLLVPIVHVAPPVPVVAAHPVVTVDVCVGTTHSSGSAHVGQAVPVTVAVGVVPGQQFVEQGTAVVVREMIIGHMRLGLGEAQEYVVQVVATRREEGKKEGCQQGECKGVGGAGGDARSAVDVKLKQALPVANCA
ncbi:methionyl-trna synthetase [Zalerion maritima]|uniref:Methionyl-trna synthetase n=1 Tax=Zalerion maritima TaxID=339359 RepID=A0AAD5RHX1_9PEZI|nr:methionyl-trna synthetase [Zalerion maritima]